MTTEKGDESSKRRIIPRIFHTELRNMMYGYGDTQHPRAESVRLMEEIVIDYITSLTIKATQIAHQHRRERPEVSDIKLVIRKDPAKLKRVRYLLEMKQEIRKATVVVNEDLEKAVGDSAPGGSAMPEM